MNNLVIPKKNVAKWVADLAGQHGVTDKPNSIIALADTITGLSDDDVKLDSVGIMLVHLKEMGILTGRQIIQVKYAQLKENESEKRKDVSSSYEI